MESLTLLSPAGLQDLQALQSSGLRSIQYPGFLSQVSSGPLGPDGAEQRGPQRSWGASRWPRPPSPLDSPCPRGCTQTVCHRPALGSPSRWAAVNVPPTQSVSLSMVLNPLWRQMMVGSHVFLGLHQRAPHFFLLSEWKMSGVRESQVQVTATVVDVSR